MNYLTVSLLHPRVLKGGAQYVAKDLHDCAAATPGWQATLLAAIDGKSFPQFTRPGNPITQLSGTPGEYILSGGQFDHFYHHNYDPRRLSAVRRFIAECRPDVIHVHHSVQVGLEFLELARAVAPKAVILYTLHEYIPICAANGHLYRHHEKAICTDTSPDQCVRCVSGRTIDEVALRARSFMRHFDLVDQFIAPSEYLRQRYIAWGIDPGRITTIGNGHSRQRPEGWTPQHSSRAAQFGFFGQHVDSKGVDLLIQAAGIAGRNTRERIDIRIFGGSKQFATEAYLQKIEGLLATLPENVCVTEMGSYTRESVFELMSTVDWVVVPSIWPETFALVVSEARDARRPVIAARAGGLIDRIRHDVDGLQFAPGSVTGLADLIETCAGNIDLWRRLSGASADEPAMAEAWLRHIELIATLRAGSGLPAEHRIHAAQ